MENIVSIIEKVCDEMCTHYCKYKEQSWEALEKDEIFEKCDACPLHKLK